jgi:CRAL/TRIO domain
MTLIRPFVKKELFEAMHFHTSGYESLYDYVPKEDLPEEYGGEAGKIDDIFEKWLKIVEDQKEYLNDSSNWKLSE